MLHRSFNPAKCKTALKLSVSRIKLLKNKKEALVKQQRRELAQLLESGQERTARIRVEHVVREEKAMAAYDLIEIYCELIVARMPIIESQKNCPIDLKEAIASVIFASPRCADIPELMDVRKHFTKKYGKEFVAAALEIRPDCGVSRLLVEKLSAKAPDGPAKIKILTAIAEEHNVKWDRESFEENETKPQEDLLNGPNTFGQATKMPVESFNLQQVPDSNERLPVHSHSSNSRSPLHSQNHHSTSEDASHAMPPGTSHPQSRTSGNTSESMESRHFYASGQASSGRQNWPMEFTDATTAAQAAAESAERASMAARAAAELSSQGRITRQHSTESNKPSVSKPVDEAAHRYGKDPARNSSGSNTRMHFEQTPEDEEDELAALTERFNNLKSSITTTRTEYSNPGSDSRNTPSTAGSDSGNTPPTAEKSDRLGEASMKRESSESDDEYAGESYSGVKPENVGYFEQPSFGKQSSNASYHNVFSNVIQQEPSEKFSDEHYKFDEENVGPNTDEANAYGNDAGLVFDDSGSEDDAYKSSIKFEDNKQDSHLYFSSTKNPSFSRTAFSEESTAIFSEGIASDTFPSEKGNFLPVTFDDSDSPDSDSEDELKKSEVVATKEPGIPESSRSVGSSFTEKANLRSKRDIERNSSAVDSQVEVRSPRNQGTEAGNQACDTPSTFYSKSSENENFETSGISSSRDEIQVTQSLNTSDGDNHIEERGLESGSGLRFGNLTGGLRNKGYKHPPYQRNAPEKKTDQSLPLETNSGFEAHEETVHRKFNEKSSSRVHFSDARNELEEEQLLRASYSSQESYTQKGKFELNKKPVSSSYFDSDNSDSDEDLPKQTRTHKTHLTPVFSRRTKGTSSGSRKDSYTKSTDSVAEKKPSSSVSSHAAETRANARSESNTSDHQISGSQPSRSSRSSRSLEDRKSAEPSKPVKESSKLSAENKKVSGLRAEPPSRENSIDKASHVHPKLPDYDTLTAHLLSLRQNRE